jgi:ureidoacrylate peracid hydrolase
MENLKFDKEITALLVIDPYNDFISQGGKLWGRLLQQQTTVFLTCCKS